MIAAVAGGVAARQVHHNRKHSADKAFRRSSLSHRIDRANGEAHDTEDTATGAAQPGTPDEWVPLAVGPRGFQVGGNGREKVWMDPTAAPGIGLRGPGAPGALRACWLTILLRLGEQPPGRIVIPVPDAIKLLGTTRPATVPEGLRIVEDLDHALAALDAEISHRTANPGIVDQLPLVVLMLAEAPVTAAKADELAALLGLGHRMGVTALIGGDWPPGASIDIDREYVITATRGKAVAHLHDAYLFNTPAARVISLCPEIDYANRNTAPAADGDTARDAGTDADPAESTAHATTDPATQPIPTPPHHGPGDPEHTSGDDTGTDGPDNHTQAGAPGVPEHTPPPAPPAGQRATPAAPEHDQPSPPPDNAAPTTPTTARATAAADDGPPPRAAITTASGNGGRTNRPAAGPSTGVLRLEILHTVRMIWTPPTPADAPEQPAAINVTPGGRAPVQVLTNLALNRGGQRRATIAAALWPDTNIERPTNTFNSNRTRLRQFIQNETGGAITDLIRDNEDGTCELPAELFRVDYWEFLDAIDPQNNAAAPERARAYQKALAHYRGDLAENIHADWITEYRDNTQQKTLKAAIDLAYDLTNHHNDPETAIAILDQAVAFDPLHEPIYQHLIRLLMKLGRRDAAIQRYKTLEIELDRLDRMKPLPETARLLQQ